MIFGTLIFFNDKPFTWTSLMHVPPTTGAHDTPDTLPLKTKNRWDTPRVNKADTAIFRPNHKPSPQTGQSILLSPKTPNKTDVPKMSVRFLG